MRRLATLVTTIALAMSGMIFSPAHAVAPSNGDYVCTTGLIKTTETTNLYTITTTGSVTSVTSHSSGKCAGVVVIPDGVTSIGNSAFQNATSLTSITLPVGLKTISNYAFFEASSLTSITIPAAVTSIGNVTFYGTTSLTSFTVASGNTTYAAIAGVLFKVLPKTLMSYPANASDTSYTIPATVGTIAGYAFYGATTLTSITIPSSVTSFYAYAFQNATSLTSVYFLDNAPTSVNTTPFLNVASGAKAYIKSGATGFTTSGTPALWNGLIVEVVADTPPAAVNTPATSVDTPVQVVDTVLVALTVSAKKKYSGKALAKKVGVTIVSSKASVSISVAEKSKKICARSYSNLKTLKAGKCVVTFTVQEPKSKKGKKPKATKTTTTLVVQ